MRFLNRSAGRLSRHRRRPVAGLVLLLLALVLTGGLYAAIAPASAGPAKSDEELVAEGRKLHDKRHAIAARDWARDKARLMRARG